MPLKDIFCKACQKKNEVYHHLSEKPSCPECNSEDVETEIGLSDYVVKGLSDGTLSPPTKSKRSKGGRWKIEIG